MPQERCEHSQDERREALETPLLRDQLVTVTFATNRAISPAITSINLGTFHEEAAAVLRKTMEDPEKREYAKRVYVTHDNKVLVETGFITGVQGGTHVVVQHEIRTNPQNIITLKRYQQDRFVATVLHSHPDDLPPSPKDLEPLFYGDSDPFADSMVFVVAPSLRTLVFRGSQTPQLTSAEAAEKVALWHKLMEDRFNAHVRRYMGYEEQLELNLRVQRALLRDISRRYDLSVFQGRNDTELVTKRASEEIWK